MEKYIIFLDFQEGLPGKSKWLKIYLKVDQEKKNSSPNINTQLLINLRFGDLKSVNILQSPCEYYLGTFSYVYSLYILEIFMQNAMQNMASRSTELVQDKRLGEPLLEITRTVKDFNTWPISEIIL